MADAFKKQIKVLWPDWLSVTALIFGFYIVGDILCQIIMRTDKDVNSYFAAGTVVGGCVAALFIVLLLAVEVSVHFNLEISMGFTRKYFWASYFTVSFAGCILNVAFLAVLNAVENSFLKMLYPGWENEIDFQPYLLKWGLLAALILAVAGCLCGILIMRFGRKAFWTLWALWMIGFLGVPRIADAVESAPNSLFGKIGNAAAGFAGSIPLQNWVVFAIVASVAGLAASYILIRRQQVTV